MGFERRDKRRTRAAATPGPRSHSCGPKLPVGSVYHGSDALRAYFERFSGELEPSWWETEEVLDAGEDRVLLLIRVRGRGKSSGAKVDSRGGWLLTVRGGMAVRVDAYLERREALEAAWLRQ